MSKGTISDLKKSRSGADEPGVRVALREELAIYATAAEGPDENDSTDP